MKAVLIALLVVLGVDLTAVVALGALVLGRKRWLRRRPGHFVGAIRGVSGNVDGLASTWRRGCGRWVSNVLVWNKAPFMFRNVFVPVDCLAGERRAHSGEVKRLGDTPIVIELVSGAAVIEVATRPGDRTLATGPMTTPV
ncbi:hypothetical protein E1262_26660 [Jiangella aurantiaca]|uniref:DUF2550 family protein n=1 Tax=Jiangella aurantiaca TaxID=2530373 RepID=A0A4R4ZZW8_9ACTN|nr:hypothetical protein [Jiangella aurantiaca]TDD64941.1 hypothetical protein E1262_26660 [Jiangella aurantiaca]